MPAAVTAALLVRKTRRDSGNSALPDSAVSAFGSASASSALRHLAHSGEERNAPVEAAWAARA